MMAELSVLDVHLNEERIGVLARLNGERTLFSFDDSYLADERRPVLSLGLRNEFGEPITESRARRTRVMPFFSNLLPEGPLRDYLAHRAGVNAVREFFLLWVLGEDLPGAVVLRPTEGDLLPPKSDYPDTDDKAGSDHGRDPLRFSLAGVQLKFSAIMDATGGMTIPARGVGGEWIVKLPSAHFDRVPENEFSMMSLARQVGMDIPQIDLVAVEEIENLPGDVNALEGRALAVERFDRLPGGERIHIEDFAQVFGVYPEEKYRRASARNIAQVIAAEGTMHDAEEFVRRLVFNALIGNADMHLKNWSLMYPDRITAALAPGYDFVSTIAYLPDDKAALKFSRTKRFDEFTEDELAHLAAKALLPEKLVLDRARETVDLFHQHWTAEKHNLPLSADTVRAIDEHVRRVPLAASRRT